MKANESQRARVRDAVRPPRLLDNLATPESVAAWYRARDRKAERGELTHDTVTVLALDRSGSLGGACTTSGLSLKLPGRVGDSPIIGARLYVDDPAGAAGGTGVGEEILRVGGSLLIVEALRRPVAAGRVRAGGPARARRRPPPRPRAGGGRVHRTRPRGPHRRRMHAGHRVPLRDRPRRQGRGAQGERGGVGGRGQGTPSPATRYHQPPQMSAACPLSALTAKFSECPRSLPGFQSCSLGSRSSALKNATPAAPKGRFQSLVLLDHAPRPNRAGQPPGPLPAVSILVLLDHAPRPARQRLQEPLPAVSILVLLDHAPRPWRGLMPSAGGPLFQSLFSWITLLGWTAADLIEVTDAMFQSLFSWITLLGRRCLDRAAGRVVVSILVLLDHAPRRRRRRPRDSRSRCFNPCSLGSRSSARGSRAWASRRLAGFNPCSLGSRSSARGCAGGRLGRDVSILVLLDHAPRPLLGCNLLSIDGFRLHLVMPFHGSRPSSPGAIWPGRP